MRTSIMLSNFSWAEALDQELAAMAKAIDDSGIDSLFVADHLMQSEPGTDISHPMLEATTTLGHLAALTNRVRLGTMVASATLRPPALLIKAVTTLDVLSGGRAWFGIGAGYQQAEADDLGVELPPTAERFAWLEDTLQLARRMWACDERPFSGQRITARRPTASPPPRSVPHPPVLIGGSGERRTLPLVARYADACNLPDVGDGGVMIRRKLAVLAEHCAAVGRSLDDIDKTISTRMEPGEPVDDFVARAAGLAALGLDHLVVLTRGPWTPTTVTALAAAVPAITQLTTSPPGTS